MISCLKCGNGLDSQFVAGGSTSSCSRCGLKYMSVAELMKHSDRGLVLEFWEYVLGSDWPQGKPCPRCEFPLSQIPLLHGGQRHPVLACKACYHLILKDGTLSHFEEESPKRRRSELERQKREARRPDSVERFLNHVAEAADSRWVVRVGRENGREYVFAATLGGATLTICALFFIGQSGSSFFWSLLASACAYGAGLRFARSRNRVQVLGPAPTTEVEVGKTVRDIRRR